MKKTYLEPAALRRGKEAIVAVNSERRGWWPWPASPKTIYWMIVYYELIPGRKRYRGSGDEYYNSSSSMIDEASYKALVKAAKALAETIEMAGVK